MQLSTVRNSMFNFQKIAIFWLVAKFHLFSNFLWFISHASNGKYCLSKNCGIEFIELWWRRDCEVGYSQALVALLDVSNFVGHFIKSCFSYDIALRLFHHFDTLSKVHFIFYSTKLFPRWYIESAASRRSKPACARKLTRLCVLKYRIFSESDIYFFLCLLV